MTEKTRPEFILEATKIFIWPALIVAATLWLGPDLKEILKSRTWKIGILEVGDRVSNLESSLQDELIVQKDFLNKILTDSGDADKVKGYVSNAIASIENAQKGAREEVLNIQDAMPRNNGADTGQAAPTGGQKNASVTDEPVSASEWENQGFKHLLDRNAKSAIEAFTQAEKIWPGYHNAYEIRKLMIENQKSLEDKGSAKWKDVFQQISTQFSWGMPLEVRRQMRSHMAEQ